MAERRQGEITCLGLVLEVLGFSFCVFFFWGVSCFFGFSFIFWVLGFCFLGGKQHVFYHYLLFLGDETRCFGLRFLRGLV